MSKRKYVFAMALFGVAVFGFSAGVEATCVAWLPYATMLRNTATDASSPWGWYRDNPYFHNIHEGEPEGENPIWNTGAVFYTTNSTESTYAANYGDKNWSVIIHNPGSSQITVYLQYYTNTSPTTAAVVDEGYHWTYPDGSADNDALLVNTGTFNDGIPEWEWDSANDRWVATIVGHRTIMINTWGALSSNPMFNTPDSGESHTFNGSIRLSSSSDFLCNLEGKNYFYPRKTSNSFFGDNVMSYQWHYQGIYEAQYSTSGTNKIILPYFRELRYNNYTDSTPDFATFVRLVNGSSSSATFRIRVKDLNGTEFSNYVDKQLAVGQSFSFCPSQFFDPGNPPSDTRGYVEIEGQSTGTRPMATALVFRFARMRSTATYNGFGTTAIYNNNLGHYEWPRLLCGGSVEPFVITSN